MGPLNRGNPLKKLRFVVSLITNDNDYQREQAAAALEAAARLDVEVQTLFAENDAINQSQQLLRVIQEGDAGVDAILVEPASRTCFPRVAHAALAAGIGWGALNCEPDYLRELHSSRSAPVFSVSADNGQVGRIQGQQLAAILPKGGSVLYIQGPSGSTATELRAAGMYESKPENIRIKVLKSGNWTEDGGYQAVGSWLRLSISHKEQIDAVQAQNDFLARGAMKAIQEQTAGEERAIKLRLPLLGVDGLPKTGQEWVRQRLLTATIIVPPITAPALEIVVAALRKGTQPPERTLVQPKSFPEPEALVSRTFA
jgi:ribose transport system substrate-binding protein